MRQPYIALRFGGVGLGTAKIRRGQLRQHRTGLHRLADVSADRHHAPGKGGINALRALLIPDNARGQLYRDRLAGRRSGDAQQRELHMPGREAHLVVLHDGLRGRRRFGRRGGVAGGKRGKCGGDEG